MIAQLACATQPTSKGVINIHVLAPTMEQAEVFPATDRFSLSKQEIIRLTNIAHGSVSGEKVRNIELNDTCYCVAKPDVGILR